MHVHVLYVFVQETTVHLPDPATVCSKLTADYGRELVHMFRDEVNKISKLQMASLGSNGVLKLDGGVKNSKRVKGGSVYAVTETLLNDFGQVIAQWHNPTNSTTCVCCCSVELASHISCQCLI